jgi:hypothetical protein
MRSGWNGPLYLLISGMESLPFIISRASLCCQAKPDFPRSVGAANEDGEVIACLRLNSAQTRETITSPSYWRIDEGVLRLAFNPLTPTLGGWKKGIGGHPQTLGKGALPLCTPSMGSAGEAELARDTRTPSDSRQGQVPRTLWG